MEQNVTTPALLVDGHVHFHPCFRPGAFLDAAHANFAAAAMREQLPQGSLGCLLFAESSWHDYFRAFSNGLLVTSDSRWSIRPTMESCSLLACRDGEPALVLIAGRQIITAERLEVLALVCHRGFPDGARVEAVLESVLACGAVTVLPWGFGKWWGKRGKKVQSLLQTSLAQRVFLGDNGGRPAMSLQPSLLQWARDKHIGVLAGTDPLSLPWQVNKVGRYGFVLRQAVPLETPAATLREALCENSTQPYTYGRRESLMGFARANMGLRMRKRDSAAANGQASVQR